MEKKSSVLFTVAYFSWHWWQFYNNAVLWWLLSEAQMKNICIESNCFFASNIQLKSLFYIRKAEFML